MDYVIYSIVIIDGTRSMPEAIGRSGAYARSLRTAIDTLSHNPARVVERAGVTHAFLEASVNGPSILHLPFPFANQMGRMFFHAIARPTDIALHPESVVITVKQQTQYPWGTAEVQESTATFTFNLSEGLVTLSGDLPPYHESVIGGLKHPIYSDVYDGLQTLVGNTVVIDNAHVVRPPTPSSS